MLFQSPCCFYYKLVDDLISFLMLSECTISYFWSDRQW